MHFPQTFPLKTGESLLLREAMPDDAVPLINYIQGIAGETDFLSFGVGEFQKTEEEERKILLDHAKADNQIYLVALIDGIIVGAINAHANQKPRMRHQCEFGISVSRAHWHKGIGKLLLEALISWAKSSGVIRKINLLVNVENQRAIRLYEYLGFEVEGRIRRDTFQEGRFYDSWHMGMLLD